VSNDLPDEPLGEAARRAKYAIARDGERRLQADLESAIADKLMAQTDAGAEIARELDLNARLSLPTPGDIERAIQGAAPPQHESLQQIETLLSIDSVEDLAVEGGRLNQLLERGAATIEERNVLARGMLFLRHKKYPEAIEWWTLHAQTDRSSPFDLLLQLLVVVTYRLAGDERRAASLLAELQPRLRAQDRR
jgi:hypothetical protein